MPVIFDTGALFALADRADPAHERTRAALAAERSPIVVPEPVLTETCILMGRRRGGRDERALLESFVRTGWALEPLERVDLARVPELMDQYADADLGFVDASITAIAERLRVSRIYTLDRRDFVLVRPRHVPAFEILP